MVETIEVEPLEGKAEETMLTEQDIFEKLTANTNVD